MMKNEDVNGAYFCEWKVAEIKQKAAPGKETDDSHNFVRDDDVVIKRELSNRKENVRYR